MVGVSGARQVATTLKTEARPTLGPVAGTPNHGRAAVWRAPDTPTTVYCLNPSQESVCICLSHVCLERYRRIKSIRGQLLLVETAALARLGAGQCITP